MSESFESYVDNQLVLILNDVNEAKSLLYSVLEDAKKGNYLEIDHELSNIDRIITKLYSLQGNLIQKSLTEKNIPYCLMVTHVQDQVMNLMSEKRLIEELIRLYRLIKV